MRMPKKFFFIVVAAALLSAACASYDGRGLKPGVATEMDVRNVMGTPAFIWQEPDGGARLAYPRGPAGLQTFMVQMDSQGRLAAIEQVLDEEHFSRIKRGIDTNQVAWQLGPPFQTIPFKRRNEIAWDYRYRDIWGYVAIFSVIFDEDGKVKTTVRVREESLFPLRGF